MFACNDNMSLLSIATDENCRIYDFVSSVLLLRRWCIYGLVGLYTVSVPAVKLSSETNQVKYFLSFTLSKRIHSFFVCMFGFPIKMVRCDDPLNLNLYEITSTPYNIMTSSTLTKFYNWSTFPSLQSSSLPFCSLIRLTIACLPSTHFTQWCLPSFHPNQS